MSSDPTRPPSPGTNTQRVSTSPANHPLPIPTPRPPPPLCPILPDGEDYDAWVLAGGRLFRAHGSVLASHSAYLRACIGSERDIRVLLPHVPPTGFAAVLAYMYTGRLPLTPATLYEVLITGHLLQMPTVVSLCQALLTTTTASTAAITASATLDTPEVPPALCVWRGLARLVPPHHQVASATPAVPSTIVRPTPTRPYQSLMALNPTQDPSKERRGTEDCLSGSPKEAISQQKRDKNVDIAMYVRDNEEVTDQGRAGAVIIDIAACDGPVFFERVINRAYKANPLVGHEDSETDTEINVEEVDSGDDTQLTMSENTHPKQDAIKGMRGLNNYGLNNTLQIAASAIATSPPTPNNHISRTYHCVYCNHTFKSHYCYQKHMRRHINPITVEIDKLRGSGVHSPASLEPINDHEGCAEGTSESWGSNSKRPVGSSTYGIPNVRPGSTSPYSNKSLSPASSGGLKILDLNVQYFPCKTCGSKFPSYYFVHKHRRLCHQDEETSSISEKSSCQSTPKNLPPSTATSSD